MTRPLNHTLRSPSKGTFATMTAAGTAQSDAAEMTADEVLVTAGAEDSGVLLPTMGFREECIVANGLNVTIKVYPRSGGQLNGATADNPLILDPFTAARFRAATGVHVLAFF